MSLTPGGDAGGKADVTSEKPKIVIDLNECMSASALEAKIATHTEEAEGTKSHPKRSPTPPEMPLERGQGDADGGKPAKTDDDVDAAREGSKAHFVGGKLEYCICRKPDINRFMIGCDSCNKWFHGDCIGIREDESRSIKRWFCQVCKSKDPKLQIEYKPPKLSSSPPRESKEGKSKSSKRCGDCIACHEKEDCGRCDYCRDMPKFGGPFKRRQKCRQRQCINLGRGTSKHAKSKYRSDDEDDFYDSGKGGGRDGTFDDDDSEDGLFTGEEDNSEDDEGTDAKQSISRKSYDYDPDFRPVKKKPQQQQHSVPKSRPKKAESGNGMNNDDSAPEERLFASAAVDEPRRKTLKLKNVESPKSASLAPSTSSETRRSSSYSKSKDKAKDRKGRKTKKSGRAFRGSIGGSDMFSNSFLFDSGVDHPDNSQDEPREEVYTQCYGPGCTRASRSNSKYCSDDCGLRLATNRLYELLPQRIQQWQSSSCAAEGLDMKKLEKIRQKLGETSKRLSDLDKKHKALDAIVDKAKSYKADPDYDPDDEDETEMMFYCVTCGHEVNVRRAATHMERCFTRFESQTSFGSLYRTNIDGQSFFCDAFNKESNTYCKRLRVICPEHFKDKKVEPHEICGCPLTKDLFVETSSLCKAPKKKCQNHINWERLRRAEIDMERVRDLMDLEDLYEEERTIRQGMASRAGVLGLMLHSTIDHEALARQVSQMQSVSKQQQQQHQQQQQQQQLQRQNSEKQSS